MGNRPRLDRPGGRGPAGADHFCAIASDTLTYSAKRVTGSGFKFAGPARPVSAREAAMIRIHRYPGPWLLVVIWPGNPSPTHLA